jgi:hypothetical protein
MCPVCLENFDQAAMCQLDCGGNHFLCPACVQQMAAGLVPVTSDDQGPRGSLINYVDLPGCPECRGRFHLVPHVQDPLGLDNFPNNHPDPSHLPRYYYDATGGLTGQKCKRSSSMPLEMRSRRLTSNGRITSSVSQIVSMWITCPT